MAGAPESPAAGEFLQIMAMVPGRFHQELHVIDGALKAGTELVEPPVKIIIGQQGKNRDAEPAGGGDERLGNAAAHLGGGRFLI